MTRTDTITANGNIIEYSWTHFNSLQEAIEFLGPDQVINILNAHMRADAKLKAYLTSRS